MTVKGGFPAQAQATKELEARLTGHPVSGADVFAAARDLEAAYGKAGYVLVRVILPPQQLVNGARLSSWWSTATSNALRPRACRSGCATAS